MPAGCSGNARRTRRSTAYLDRLREIGASERMVDSERDGWILVAARWPELTASEFAVVQLVTQGASDREVAQRLYISAHTVNSHLRHVFTKLGIRSRVELARLAGERLLPR